MGLFDRNVYYDQFKLKQKTKNILYPLKVIGIFKVVNA